MSKSHVVLYSDGSHESEEAEKLLQQRQISLEVEHGMPGPDERYPVALHQAWQYRGIEKIRVLCDQLDFKDRQSARA